MTDAIKPKAVAAIIADIHKVMRTAEMSSGIMLDPRRTGNWSGAQRAADAFDRIGLRLAEIKANLTALQALGTEEGGWVRVPREPTEAMIHAGDGHDPGFGSLSGRIYRAMLAAAPAPPEALGGKS